MSSYVPVPLRRHIADRANRLCEYCLIHEADTYFGCQVEHIVSEKHGGATDAENLAYACVLCNRYKGSDIGSIAQGSSVFTRFFNPRTDKWSEHFRLDAWRIVPLTTIGEVTARILQLNGSDRCTERERLQAVGRYPCDAARSIMSR